MRKKIVMYEILELFVRDEHGGTHRFTGIVPEHVAILKTDKKFFVVVLVEDVMGKE